MTKFAPFEVKTQSKEPALIVSRDEYYLKVYYNKKVPSANALIVFTIFLFVVEKIKNKDLAIPPLKLLTNF